MEDRTPTPIPPMKRPTTNIANDFDPACRALQTTVVSFRKALQQSCILKEKKKKKKKTSPSNNEPASTNHDCAFSRDFVGNETSLHSAEKGTKFKQGSHDTV